MLALDMPATDMVAISGGQYRPLYMKKDSELYSVGEFLLDSVPVSNLSYFEFTQQYGKWRKSNIPTLFAEENYLGHWRKMDDTWLPDASQAQQPVVNVSWFAADAYCRHWGKRLPSVAEWEYVARASETEVDGSKEAGYRQKILDWYARPTIGRNIGQRPPNYWGVQDLHGLTWEWTQDFNSALTSGESRADGSVNTDLYCAAAAAGSTDPGDYAAFMRYGFRSSLKARYTINNLGFRCAADIPEVD